MFCRIVPLVLILAISVSGYVVEKRPKCVWFGCFGGLIKNVEAKEITVTPNDIARLVLNQLDETELRKIVTETVPSSHDLNVLYMVSDLGTSEIVEKLKPIIHTVVHEVLPTTGLMSPQETVTSQIAEHVSYLIRENVVERNNNLGQKKQTSMNKRIQSMINDMWPIVTRTIKDSIDISNINKAKYDRMVDTLMPELLQTVQSSHIRRVLGYPIVKDEVKIAILNSQDTVRRKRVSYSVYDLTDTMFSKMVPFMREGIMNELKMLEKESLELAVQQITERFEPTLRTATRGGLVHAGKLQVAINQEMADHSIRNEALEMIKPIVKPAVVNVMHSLHSKGFSTPGAVNDYVLTRLVHFNIAKLHNKNVFDHTARDALVNSLEKRLDYPVSLPKKKLDSLRQLLRTLYPKIHELVMEEVDNFRQQNPQFTDCGANILAATVIGSLKSRVKTMTTQFLESMQGTTVDDQAVIERITEAANPYVDAALEAEANDLHDFDSGKFSDSEAFDDVKARVQSGLYTIIMREVEKHQKANNEE